MPEVTARARHWFVPYNGKIADITHADILHHYLDLQAALGETREIVAVIIQAYRMAGTGNLLNYPNEGATAWDTGLAWYAVHRFVVIARGTNRLDYRLDTANDDFDLYCFGYVVEE